MEKKKSEEIYKSHLEGYQTYFNRVSLDLVKTKTSKLPTNERIINFKTTNDPDLISLYFQFGRYLDFMIRESENNWLVVSPSISPEHVPTGHPESSLTHGATIDNQLIFDLFSRTAKAAEILGKDEEFITELNEKLLDSPPMQIGSWGQLQEWIKYRDDLSSDNRYVSNLYGLYPSNQISPYRNKQLFEAAKTSLMARGDESTGWSMG